MFVKQKKKQEFIFGGEKIGGPEGDWQVSLAWRDNK